MIPPLLFLNVLLTNLQYILEILEYFCPTYSTCELDDIVLAEELLLEITILAY